MSNAQDDLERGEFSNYGRTGGNFARTREG